MKKTYWTIKDGTRVPISDMTDAHLDNAIAMLIRMAKIKWCEELDLSVDMIASCRGDMASYYAEQAFDEAALSDIDAFLPDVYYHLMKEKEKRVK